MHLKSEEYDSIFYDKGFYVGILFDKSCTVDLSLVKEKMEMLKVFKLNPIFLSHRIFQSEQSKKVGLMLDVWDGLILIPIHIHLPCDIQFHNHSKNLLNTKRHIKFFA